MAASMTEEFFDWLRTCPALADLWSIGATEDIDVSVIIPQGASQRVSYREAFDVYGNYSCDIIPLPSLFEDFQINCFRFVDAQDASDPGQNLNVLTYNDVKGICDWIGDAANTPTFETCKVVSVECFPFVPQIRFVDNDRNIVCYYITVRVRYVNPINQPRNVEYAADV